MHVLLNRLYGNHRIADSKTFPCSHTFLKNFGNSGNILIGLYFALSVGSLFLQAGTMLDNFKESGNFLFL